MLIFTVVFVFVPYKKWFHHFLDLYSKYRKTDFITMNTLYNLIHLITLKNTDPLSFWKNILKSDSSTEPLLWHYYVYFNIYQTRIWAGDHNKRITGEHQMTEWSNLAFQNISISSHQFVLTTPFGDHDLAK